MADASQSSGGTSGPSCDIDLDLLDVQFDELMGDPPDDPNAIPVTAEAVTQEVKHEANATPLFRS